MMGIALELLMASDGDITALVRKPKQVRAFLKKNWSGASADEDHQTRHSMSIWNDFDEIDYVLRAGRPDGELPLGFLNAEGNVLAKAKRMRRLRVGGEIVEYPEYDDDFYYGPPHAFFSKQVGEFAQALASIDDDWIERAYNPDELIPLATREAPDFDVPHHVREHVESCQEGVRELRAFVARVATAEMGLIRFHW